MRVYTPDAAGNPSADTAQLSVLPPSLAQVSGLSITAGDRRGEGLLVVTAGAAPAFVRLSVTDRLAALTIDPRAPDVDSGQSQQFTLAGTSDDGQPVPVPASVARWTVDPPALGSVDAAGVFTAGDGAGMATVTATADGQSAGASVAVGRVGRLIDDMTDVQNWATSLHGATGSLSLSTAVQVTAGATTLAPGDHLQLTATGTTPAGDDQKALQVPVADPISHVWASSDPDVAKVDPVSGAVTALAPGIVTISCEADGMTGQLVLTVTG